MARKSTLPLRGHEDRALRVLSLAYRIPSDQYRRRLGAANRFLRDWNNLVGRQDCWADVIHHIITQRKQKKWVTFKGDYLRLADPDWDLLSPVEWVHLDTAYREVVMGRKGGSDNLMFDNQLGAELARRFARLSGRSVPSHTLTGLVVSKRKRGEWVTLTPRAAEENDAGFNDFADAEALTSNRRKSNRRAS